MSFNTALSGIRAANTDLQVTGNNIANASTIGFKSSRAEFGDVYSSTLLGGGSNTPGSGVTIQNIRQQFTQGNLKFTQNELDLSVNGEGFFVVEKNGERLFTRAGTFGLDKDGYIVNGTGALLQGFSADDEGNVSGVISDLRVDVSSQEPRQTTGVDASYNLDSREVVLETTGSRFTTDGVGIGTPIKDSKISTASVLDIGTPAFVAPWTLNFATTPFEFEVERVDPITLATSSATITLNTGTVSSLDQLATLINSANAGETPPLNIVAATDDVTGNLILRDMAVGSESTISITTPITLPAAPPAGAALALYNSLNAVTPANFTQGVAKVTNGYGSHTLEFQGPKGAVVKYTSAPGSSAAKTASELNSLSGISATARTTATILSSFTSDLADNFRLNDVPLKFVSTPAGGLKDLADEINSLSSSKLLGISATYDETTGNIELVSATGMDLDFAFTVQDAGNFIEVVGPNGTETLDGAPTLPAVADDNLQLKVGGAVTVTMQEGYKIISSTPPATGGQIFGIVPLTESNPFYSLFYTPIPVNAFDPNDQKTFNHATTTPVYDSLGNVHSMRQFFVKQPYDIADPSTSPNHWKMYVQIDGQNVGDPDPTLPSPENTVATMASYNIHFAQDGTIDPFTTDTMLVSNWTPLGEDGEPIGAFGPLNVLQGGTVPVAEPPASSNFLIDLEGSTQFGSIFSVEELDQNGYATGRLAGLDISNTGIVFARFTNGEAQVLGQVALANFSSVDGLKPTGDTMWAQTFESGEAIVGTPGSSQLGNITAGAVEESNVDLSEQLVNLIIAQRNYQANAKTIETANATTQTILNLR